MTYQALARTWRPRSFAELVGQGHVVKALSNALDQGRVHHAFLFTGTRGVGKTTVARILAKCLNCERGVSSTPCGECSACKEIEQGRHVDLIEVDAASRAKVDETRELMNNVQFAPTRARHKVYLIDEVHMFSDASFNALLKTLEEPPPHVKFLLATTDPQRMPVTVLSRCLQFSLKRLPAVQIGERIERILGAEQIEFEPGAVRMLARAADGSLRDALSLLDQAISHGGGQVQAEPVRAMLGLLDRRHVRALVEQLARGDGAALLAQVDAIAGDVADYGEALAELLGELKQIAVAHAVPEVIADEEESQWLREMAAAMDPEDVQLYYQIGLIGRRDLPLAPDPRTGFEMTLLRMLAFMPDGAPQQRAGTPRRAASSAASSTTPASAAPAVAPGAAASRRRPAARGEAVAPRGEEGTPRGEEGTPRDQDVPRRAASAELQASRSPRLEPAPAADSAGAPPPDGSADWAGIVAALSLQGLARELACNCELAGIDEARVRLRLGPEHRPLASGGGVKRLEEALSQHLGRALKLQIDVSERCSDSPAEIARRDSELRRREAVRTLQSDPGVIAIMDAFGGSIEPDSIRPVD
jgi:DNA polymerase-3 subunit gamma/tau